MSSLLIAAALAFSPPDAHLAYEKAKDLVENCTPRDAGTPQCGYFAANRILDAASAAGANVRRDYFRAATPKGEKRFTNLHAEFKCGDTNAPWIVLLSHYDTKPGCGCPGANDGASTSGLLIGFANAFSNWREPKANLLLVWTDGEECMEAYSENDGLWGSKRAAETLAAEKRKVAAVVCLDMLGDRDLAITVPANGTKSLVDAVLLAAKRTGQKGLVRTTRMHVKDDHTAFLNRGFPAIDLIDFSYGPKNAYWHTPEDTMDKVSEESLLKSGRLVAEFINILLSEGVSGKRG